MAWDTEDRSLLRPTYHCVQNNSQKCWAQGRWGVCGRSGNTGGGVCVCHEQGCDLQPDKINTQEESQLEVRRHLFWKNPQQSKQPWRKSLLQPRGEGGKPNIIHSPRLATLGRKGSCDNKCSILGAEPSVVVRERLTGSRSLFLWFNYDTQCFYSPKFPCSRMFHSCHSKRYGTGFIGGIGVTIIFWKEIRTLKPILFSQWILPFLITK